ncbi:MAG: hypothetical protein DI629_04705 [Mesorhizobium amorphae]|nr:MAG: hypothetical protein DI629_04705 [Mesorhizobium amorphae]
MPPAPDALLTLSDDDLLDHFQRAAFGYFPETASRRNGLVPDTSRKGSAASIAVVGFALSSYPIGVERGWIGRDEAAHLTLLALRFFHRAPQGREEDAAGFKGFFYHFLDMRSGRRAMECELSMLDSALLYAGMLCAAQFFDGPADDECEIRALAAEIYDRVDWRWAQSDKVTIRHGWRPRSGFLRWGWDGYNEAAILYILALGSHTHPISRDSYDGWTSTYRWEEIYGKMVLYGGPLFLDQFSHAWIDFAGIRDAFMRERDFDYFENSVRATEIHREYARRNEAGWAGYCEDFWGMSAGDGPGNMTCKIDGQKRKFFGYKARGAPFGPDDGTVSPWSYLASMPFTPAPCIKALRHLLEHHPQSVRTGRLPSGINPTLAGRKGFEAHGWVSDGFFGLDQGIGAMMAENHRTGLIWRLMRRSPPIREGLLKAGFEGGWLDGPAEG